MALRKKKLEMTDSGSGSTTKADDQKSRKHYLHSRYPPTPRLRHKQPLSQKKSVITAPTIGMKQQTPAADMRRIRLWYGILIVPNARPSICMIALMIPKF